METRHIMAKLHSALIILLATLVSVSADARAAPRRIVSLNMCADQLLIALADRSQIAALTKLSRDPALSYYSGKAKSYPVASSSVEAVLALRPDMVIAPPYYQNEALSLLKRQGTSIVHIDDANNLDMIFHNIRLVAKAIGHADRGEAMIARMQSELTLLYRNQPGRGRVAAYYQRRGFLTGTGTLWDEILTRAGLVNLAAKLDRPSLSRLSVEEMIAARPDFLVMDTDTRNIDDRGTEMIHHPALAKAIPVARRFYMHQSLTTCGGPFYTAAVANLQAQIKRADRSGNMRFRSSGR